MPMLPVQLDGITAEGEEARFVTGSTASLLAGALTLAGSRRALSALFSPSRRPAIELPQ